jgi:cytochrome P450
MTRAAEAAADRLEMSIGRAANMVDHMTAATFDVIADVTFSDGSGREPRGRGGGAGTLYRRRRADEHSRRSGRSRSLDPAPGPRTCRPAIATDACRGRRRHRAAQARGSGAMPDLLDRLLEAEDGETGRRMDAATLRENLLTFIVAGHETTALTLSWALYLCAFDQDVQEALRAEAQNALGARAAGAGTSTPSR